jgi:hypothetical protein
LKKFAILIFYKLETYIKYILNLVYQKIVIVEMECPSCYEIYNEKERVPRNLNCGKINLKKFRSYLLWIMFISNNVS